MNFWTDDINEHDIQSPIDIMTHAGDELRSRASTLEVSIVTTELEDRLVLAFHIQNKAANLSLRLFEVSHRLDHSYPLMIDPPPPDDTPEFLKRERYVSGKRGIVESLIDPGTIQAMHAMQGSPGFYVKNEWVCSTPSEFREKLKKMFSKDHVKTQIISLISPTRIQRSVEAEIIGSCDAAPPEEQAELET